MNAKFGNSFILLWLIVASEFAVKAESPCEAKHVEKLDSILSTGNLKFSINLYKKMKDGKNLFFSPFSVRVALAMTAAGAAGTTLAQMNQALELNEFQSARQSNMAFQSHLESFCPNANFTLTTGNRIYVQKNSPIRKSFIKTVKQFFLSSAENVDFQTDADGVTKRINEWVEERTNRTIKDLIPKGALNSDTVFVLVNAIYFKGKWSSPFQSDMTNPRPFHLANGQTVEVPIMHIKTYFEYTLSSHLKSQILRMNYKGERLAMYVILPEEGTRLSEVRKKLNSKIMNDVMHNLSTEEVKVYLPKFKVSYSEELTGPLEALGMVDVFGGSADLRGISTGFAQLSTVFHQAFVAVDEEGTVAAAATGAVGIGVSAQPEPVLFEANRPFIYLIYDWEFQQILFMGNLDDPSSDKL